MAVPQSQPSSSLQQQTQQSHQHTLHLPTGDAELTYQRVRSWGLDDVRDWLWANNLGQHAGLFLSNDIRGAALLQLDHAVLKEMGIPIVGDRLRLLSAIRTLHKKCAANATMAPAASTPSTPLPPPVLGSVPMQSSLSSPTQAIYHTPPSSSMHLASPTILSPPARTLSPSNLTSLAPLRTQRTASVDRYTSELDARTATMNNATALSPLAPVSLPSAAPSVTTPVRRPNTSTGVSPVSLNRPSTSSMALTSGTAPMRNSPATSRLRRPASSNSSSSTNQVGYAVGRGTFAPKPRVAQISAPYNLRRGESSDSEEPRLGERLTSTSTSLSAPSTHSTSTATTTTSSGHQVPSLETIRKHIVKFLAEDGTSRSVDVSRCRQASDVLAKVLHKFGALTEPDSTQYMRRWVVAMTDADAQLKVLSEMELMTVCSQPHIYDPVWRHGLYLLRTTDEAPLRPGSQREAPVDTFRSTVPITRRASTFSILSGLGGGELSVASASTQEEGISPTRSTMRIKPKTPTEGALPNVRRRVRNFFGQRPSSELISSHLADYFPSTDSRELHRYSGLAQSTSTDPLPPATSSILDVRTPTSTIRPYSLHQSDADDNASLLTVDEITQDLEERQTLHPVSTQPSSGLPASGKSDREAPAALGDTNRAPAVPPVVIPAGPAAASGPAPLSVASTPGKAPLRWHKGALIGAGSFGKVFLGMNAKTGLLMAVKQVELPKCDDENTRRRRLMVDSLEAEIALLKTIQHPNIVQYLDSNSDGDYLNIFLEYVPGGSVVALLRNYGAFEEPLVQNFVRQILQGLAFLHARDIVHRDIKGANILVDNKGGVKISDFGISKKVESGLLVPASAKRPVLQGSVFWMAPEVVKQSMYTPKADIWSLGCCVVEMFTGTHPWPNLDQMQALFQIGMVKAPPLPTDISAEATAFLGQTFVLQHEERPAAAVLLQHTFLTQGSDDAAADDEVSDLEAR